jgi:diguanylate cyclase (GGDEF)-like protein/PAS domain S-box-containing protein
MEFHGSYDPVLVVLSVAVAVFASFTALNLAGRLLAADASNRNWWLLAAALSLGGGIWSMHFVGMLALTMPMPTTYDLELTFLSLIIPFVAAGAGLYILCQFQTGWRPLLAGGLLVGVGAVAMHYVGMKAMRMPGVAVTHDPRLVAASVAIAIGAATAALALAFRTRDAKQRLAASAVMGSSIASMHYTAMAAANFTMTAHTEQAISPALQPGMLGVAVFSGACTLLLLALLTAFFDRKLATLTASEAEALVQSERRYRSLIENVSDVIAVLDCKGTFIYESSSAWRVLGYRTEYMFGKRLTDFVRAENIADAELFLSRVRAQPSASVTVELPLRHSSGTLRDFEIVGKNLLDQVALEGIVVTLRDITERKQFVAQLETLSETDLLTETLNRRGFLKYSELEFDRVRRNKRKLTLVMLDLDHFKRVNDTYGHAAGDLVLATVTKLCRQQIREVDLLGRVGGEEFLILLADETSNQAYDVVERLRQEIAAVRVSTIKGEVSFTASFGVVTIDPEIHDLEAALRLADDALYEAKHAGRNCIRIRA